MRKLKINDDTSINIPLFDEEEDIDVESLLRIDYANLLADIASFPVILNRLGILLSEMENELSAKDLELEASIAKIKEQIRSDLISDGEKATNEKVSDLLKLDKKYQAKQIAFNQAKRKKEDMSSIYWAAKAKSDLLIKLSLTIQSGDIDLDLIKEKFNTVRLKNIKRHSK
jgi:aspartyl-tRNA synthetase